MGLRGRAQVLELRLDYLRDAAERAALLRWISRHLARQHSHRASYQLAHKRPEPATQIIAPQSRAPVIIATCRTRAGGGKFSGTVHEEIEVLAEAVRAGCLWCDVEIETAERLDCDELRARLLPARILVSAHDFQRLPPRLPILVRKLRRCGGDAVKVAAVCRSLAETRRLLALAGDRGAGEDVVAVPMGSNGAVRAAADPQLSIHDTAGGQNAGKDPGSDDAAPRLLALREGAALTYASVGLTTAPGQLTLDALKRVYHVNRVFGRSPTADSRRSSSDNSSLGDSSVSDPSPGHASPESSSPAYSSTAHSSSAYSSSRTIRRAVSAHSSPLRRSRVHRSFGPSRSTRVYGVIGDPIAHSLSPLLHNTAFAARGLDAIYLPFHVHELPGNPRNLADFIKAVQSFDISGFSVTLPHKQRILRYLDVCEPLAAKIGAVNTVIVRRGRLSGYNTDYVGVLRALERRVALPASRVLLVGAGGAARAAAFALVAQGARVFIWARRRAQARLLACAAGAEAIDRAALRRASFDAILNCTPVGMYSTRAAISGSNSPLEASELNCRVVMDLIYRPQKTELLYLAERRSIDTISGVEMFLAQGIAQWEMWMGERAPRAAMRRAVLGALADEERASAQRDRLAAI